MSDTPKVPLTPTGPVDRPDHDASGTRWCGRCRTVFAVPVDAGAAVSTGWWLCEPCWATLFAADPGSVARRGAEISERPR
jgi:hypothetical protein